MTISNYVGDSEFENDNEENNNECGVKKKRLDVEKRRKGLVLQH